MDASEAAAQQYRRWEFEQLEKRISALEAQTQNVVKPVDGSCTCGHYCVHYGNEQRFCPGCGAKLDWSEITPKNDNDEK